MNPKDIQIYLPKYLSSESYKELFDGLKDFPDNIDSRIYTTHLRDSIIYQGDCLKDMLVVNLPDVNLKKSSCLVLSNTCDIDLANQRHFPSQIIYTPLIKLDKYKVGLINNNLDKVKVESHIDAIKKQQITQIFFLPQFGDLIDESIIFLDRLYNVNNDYIKRSELNDTRLFSLSDYGNYLFLYKLSLHFTRIQDKVDRRSIRI